MSKNLNVSIPDSLFERMQPLKDRLNKSAICRDALLKAVELEELRDKGTVEEFISQTMNDHLQKHEAEGRKLAIKAFNNKDMPYKMLEHVARDTEVDGYDSLRKAIKETGTIMVQRFIDNFITVHNVPNAGVDYLARGFAKEVISIYDGLTLQIS